MNRIVLAHYLLLIILAILVSGCGPTSSEQSEQQKLATPSDNAAEQAPAVREVFSNFGDALKSKDGDRAAELVSDRTVDLYGRCRSNAIDSIGTDFEDLSQLEVLLVLQLRYLLTRDDLESMSAKDVLSWGVREGLVKQDSVEGITLDKIQIDGDVALATTKKNDKPSPGDLFRFVYEDGHWKFDLYYLFVALEPAFQEIRDRAGKSKIEFAVFMMERTYGKKIPFEILNGPIN